MAIIKNKNSLTYKRKRLSTANTTLRQIREKNDPLSKFNCVNLCRFAGTWWKHDDGRSPYCYNKCGHVRC